jgi:hypothetical protein
MHPGAKIRQHADYRGFESWVSQPRSTCSKDYIQQVELMNGVGLFLKIVAIAIE